MTAKEIETVIKSLQTKKIKKNKKAQEQAGGFSVEFYEIFKEELIPILLKLFHIIET